tara:strand:+ start:3130 stop:3573 length:444 start_codon:yes stop_codon:yes gene_type:complete
MENKRTSFCFVCMANYCRSPVFEVLFKKKYGEEFEFYSAGLHPMVAPNMDPRSTSYLNKIGIKNILHTPKKISKKMLEYFDFFIAADVNVLNMLNVNFPDYSSKFFLSTRNIEDIEIYDPYTMNDIEYLDVMKKISFTVDNLDLKDF